MMNLYIFTGSVPTNPTAFGQGVGLIALNNLLCNGDELMLRNCLSETEPSSCSHRQDAGVRCQLRTGMYDCLTYDQL